jgi:hypothetical protein
MRGASGGCSYRELDVSQHHRLLGLDESDTDGTGACEREGVRLALRTSLLARSAWWTALDCPVQSKRTGEPEGTIKSWSFNGPHSPCVTEFSRRGGVRHSRQYRIRDNQQHQIGYGSGSELGACPTRRFDGCRGASKIIQAIFVYGYNMLADRRAVFLFPATTPIGPQ